MASATVSDGSTTADFGALPWWVPPSRRPSPSPTRGMRPWCCIETLTVPSGFMVTSPFASSVAYGTTTLTVEMVAATPGEYQGVVSFTDDDPIFGTVSFAVHGDVDLRRRRSVSRMASRPSSAVPAGPLALRRWARPYPEPSRFRTLARVPCCWIRTRWSCPGFSLVTPFASSVAPEHRPRWSYNSQPAAQATGAVSSSSGAMFRIQWVLAVSKWFGARSRADHFGL